MRKARSDSKLLNLPHHQQDALAAWLLEDGLSYELAKDRLHMDFNVATSETALGVFWERVCQPRQFARVAAASEAAPTLADGLESNFDVTTEAYVSQQLFMLLASREPDQKLLATFSAMKSALDTGKLERAKLAFNRQKHAETTSLKERDLALQREKFETDASAKALRFVAELKTIAANRSLTEPAKIDAVRRTMFGQDPNAQPREAQP